MANKFFQTMIYQLREAFGRPVGIIDDTGMVISYNDSTEIEKNAEDILHLCSETGKIVTCMGHTFVSTGTRGKPEFVAYVQGEDEDARRFVGILSVCIGGLKQFYDEKFDKTNFIKNIVLDNILSGDAAVKARDLHIDTEALRAVMIIRTAQDHDSAIHDLMNGMFPDKEKDFVVRIDEMNIALVKEIKPHTTNAEIEKLAQSILDTLSSEAMVTVSIGIGTTVGDISLIATSYREAHVALEVGKVFDTSHPIVSYDNLGIGRLIYQLPTTLCRLFLSEVFKKESIDALDNETIYTIQKFFENNLNVSETSRQLYVHRNTLVYRLDKVEKLTGLDLRVFDDAIVFKVAMMVKKYLESNPSKI